jgi:hypothetical protein
VRAARTVGSEPDYEAQDRDAALTAAGWDVRPASDWTARELGDRLAAQPSEPTRHRDQQNDGTTQGDDHR